MEIILLNSTRLICNPSSYKLCFLKKKIYFLFKNNKMQFASMTSRPKKNKNNWQYDSELLSLDEILTVEELIKDCTQAGEDSLGLRRV